MFFDSHCHLTDDRFGDDRDGAVHRAAAAGVVGLVTVASDADDAAAALALARSHPAVWATAGVHPHAAGAATAPDLDRVEAMARADRVVAIGETGLDYYYDNAPRDTQRRLFAWHLDLAARTGLPVVVHSRDADDDTVAMIGDAAPGARGVLHCFAGGRSLLEAGLAAGWWVSFSGLVSFRNYDGADLVRAVPADRLLVETDSPYLAPVPHRGKRNEPAYVVGVAEAVARIRGDDPAELGRFTAANAAAFYGIRLPDGPEAG